MELLGSAVVQPTVALDRSVEWLGSSEHRERLHAPGGGGPIIGM